MTPANREFLRLALAELVHTEQCWHHIESVCALAPRTIVHGDLVAKNIRVRRDGTHGTQLVVFDWEKAGVGVPSIDLSSIPCDLDHYVSSVRSTWPTVSMPVAEDLSRIGRLFRSIARLKWEIAALPFEWSAEISFERSTQLLHDANGSLGIAART